MYDSAKSSSVNLADIYKNNQSQLLYLNQYMHGRLPVGWLHGRLIVDTLSYCLDVTISEHSRVNWKLVTVPTLSMNENKSRGTTIIAHLLPNQSHELRNVLLQHASSLESLICCQIAQLVPTLTKRQ